MSAGDAMDPRFVEARHTKLIDTGATNSDNYQVIQRV